MDDQNIYKKNGYKDRNDYLSELANNYGVSLFIVESLAAIYGPEEDFNVLVDAVEDVSSSDYSEFG